MSSVPFERPPDAVPQAYSGVVRDFLTRARNVERAALRIKVHASPVYRWFDAERHADGFAQRSGDPEGPDRQVQPWWFYATDFGNQRNHLVERRNFGARENERLVRRLWVLA